MAIVFDPGRQEWYDDGMPDPNIPNPNVPYPEPQVPPPQPQPTPGMPPPNPDPNVPPGPTKEQIEAAERGRFFEGRSFGQSEADAWLAEAIGKGVPEGWARSFLDRNPNDYNRIYEQWLDEQSPNGAENRNA